MIKQNYLITFDEKTPMTTEEILKMNEKRFISHSTIIKCAKCGNEFKINNRYKLPFRFKKINDSIGEIIMPCASCHEEYDLGICIHT